MKGWVIATLAAALVLTGCGSGNSGSPPADSPTTAPTSGSPASTSPTPAATVGTITEDPSIAMPAGTYGTVHFTPAFTFSTPVTLGGGADGPDVANFSLKNYGNSYFAGWFFTRFAKVCDPTAPSQLTASPDRLLECLVHNPNLRVTAEPTPVTISGVSGQQLDVQVIGKLPGPQTCNGDPHPCVRIGTVPGFVPAADGFGIEDKTSARIWILDVDGTTVTVVWNDLTDQFDSNIATAETIVQTVQFP